MIGRARGIVTFRDDDWDADVVARSSAKTEYIYVAHGSCEVLWLKELLEELKISMPLLIKVHCGNKSAIAIAHNPIHHDRIMHMKIANHLIKKDYNGIICMRYVLSINQVADILTKGLHK